MSEKTFFGYKKVTQKEKPLLVDKVFSSVASKYDLMNDLMSGGMHRMWKNSFINEINASENNHLIDVAAGTADISIRFLKKNPKAKVTLSDVNFNMLTEASKKLIDHNLLGENIDLCCNDACDLSFPDDSFDFYTIAFGIRNITNIDKALKEAMRVLKPGGQFLCLEFSNVENYLVSQVYDLFSFAIIPKIGRIFANDTHSYQYLVESIRKFPNKDVFASIIKKVGFSLVKYRSLSNGIVAIHTAWKI